VKEDLVPYGLPFELGELGLLLLGEVVGGVDFGLWFARIRVVPRAEILEPILAPEQAGEERF
jgi:hypothetical protein